ncbi:uncharacterized protein LOC110727014 [Chenopodium quinoa]|uniref:uncharacterized protein LOC110727014 n=1 Tax=Chenopodium quinoa TaxID=63459 RepID=UPI000B78C19A|nr:uncharacterized protein LOC110727014 [Chenopodium quinoa]
MAALMWAAWRGRNLTLFQGENPNGVMLAADFVRLVHDFNTYAKRVLPAPPSAGQPQQATCAQWKKPSHGWVKVNLDAHVLEGCKVGLGVAIRDAECHLLAAAVKVSHYTSPEVAEAMAIR